MAPLLQITSLPSLVCGNAGTVGSCALELEYVENLVCENGSSFKARLLDCTLTFIVLSLVSAGCGFESGSSRHVGTLGTSLTHSCLWHFGVKLQYSIRAVSGAPLSSSGLEEAL